MGDKISLSWEELEDHFKEQIQFLQMSADSYDLGFDSEAKRLAVTIRVLMHDTTKSHSLLGQLGRLNHSYITTAIPHDPRNKSTHGGLVAVAMAGKESKYVPMLDDVPFIDWISFQGWWNQPVFIDNSKNVLSRNQLILIAANQDGGAHIDPALDKIYARLSRHNSLQWVVVEGAEEHPIPKAERAAIRQIAHEVLRTLIPGYKKKPNYQADMFFTGGMLVEGAKAPPLPSPHKFGRNDPCPCGSGRKYKKCHGMGTNGVWPLTC